MRSYRSAMQSPRSYRRCSTPNKVERRAAADVHKLLASCCGPDHLGHWWLLRLRHNEQRSRSMLKKFTVIPGPQIHDSQANSPMGRVRFQTANREGSSCRLRYRYARILMRRSCAVWPGEAKMDLKPGGFWRLRRSTATRVRRRALVSARRTNRMRHAINVASAGFHKSYPSCRAMDQTNSSHVGGQGQ